MELLECMRQWGAVFSKEKRADLQAWEVIKKDKEIGHLLWARQGFLKDIMEMSKNPFNFIMPLHLTLKYKVKVLCFS